MLNPAPAAWSHIYLLCLSEGLQKKTEERYSWRLELMNSMSSFSLWGEKLWEGVEIFVEGIDWQTYRGAGWTSQRWMKPSEDVYLQFFHQSVGWWPLWGPGEASGNRRCWWSRSGCVYARSAALHAGSLRSAPRTRTHVSGFRHWVSQNYSLQVRCSTTDLQSLLEELHASFLPVAKLVRKAPVSNEENHRLMKK